MSEKNKKRLDFIIKVCYFALIAVLVWAGLKAIGLIMPLVMAMLIVAILNPIVRFLHRKIKSNKKAISLGITVLLYIGVGFLIFAIIAKIISISQTLFTGLPGYYQDVILPMFSNISESINTWVADLSPSWTNTLNTVLNSLTDSLKNMVTTISSTGISLITAFIGDVPGVLMTALFTILLSFFASVQYDQILQFAKSHVSEKAVKKTMQLIAILKSTVLKYFRAVLILMLCTFVELTIGFFILGVPNPFGKALIIAIFDALPIFGTGGIMIPWVLIELIQGNFAFAGGIAILYAVVTVVRNILEPKIVSDQLGLNPIIALTSIYVGFKLIGIMGMIFFPIIAQVLMALHKHGFFDSENAEAA